MLEAAIGRTSVAGERVSREQVSGIRLQYFVIEFLEAFYLILVLFNAVVHSKGRL
jgi:hypothetical protein